MKKKHILLIFFMGVFIVIAVVFSLFVGRNDSVDVANAKGFLYYSTSATNFVTRGSLYVINDENEVQKLVKTDGMDLGQIYQQDHMFILNDNKATYFIHNDEIVKEKRADTEHTAIFSSVIDGKRVELYNHGYIDQATYGSHLYWEHDGAMQFAELRYFISTAGSDGKSLFVIEEDDEENNEIILRQIALDQTIEDTPLLVLADDVDNYLIMTDMLAKNNQLYYIVNIDYDYALGKVDLNTMEQSETPFLEVKNNGDIAEHLPSKGHSGIHMTDDFIYFYDGTGVLYQFNLEGTLLETLSTVPDYHEYNDIFPAWDDETLYIFKNGDDSTIQSVNLLDMALQSEIEIDTKNLKVNEQFLFDFKIINGF
ncbi:hypothetical protein MM221_15160 [Salipaludibacillus sp. LMS25]|uniref:hypothetical protein n=1 Tax=Salipaludibacillus sp. LMS25 TaxID=2924031 RepID=UPI0020D042C9|nr:hypothetical protein [Salipaludibacillus sp. LMS25]UTR13936.1 hypothetical protein MM221_15160 [Salipaludibacillus sp. LMS25]